MRSHRSIAVLVPLALVTSLLSLPSAAAAPPTPTDSLTIVTANLQEAWDYRDTQSHWDMDKFVRRIAGAKFKPDVLAVQEVRRSSARYVARKLSARMDRPYRVVVMPPSSPYQRYKGRAGAYATSIIANVATMKVLHRGGYFPTSARRDHVVEPHDPVFFQAYALLQRRATGEKFAVMSTHLYPRGYLANMDLDKSYRNKWAKQMRRKLYDRYGGRSNMNYVIAGDFNQTLCLRGYGGTCFKTSPFVRNLTRAGYVNTAKSGGSVDMIWAKGMPSGLHEWDEGLAKMRAGARYSDHPFRWTVLGPDRYAPASPRPVTLDLRKGDSGAPVTVVKWWQSHDRGGVGISHYDFQRKVNDRPWETIAHSGRVWHHDRDLRWGQKVRYRIRVVDKKGNATGYVRRGVEVKRSNV